MNRRATARELLNDAAGAGRDDRDLPGHVVAQPGTPPSTIVLKGHR
ncbi:MAG: hypothetical protein P4M07_05060 [Xanthobacteraceae bacterium]|nr:hypothetical protein [Xanthobacteraceae bacterium]